MKSLIFIFVFLFFDLGFQKVLEIKEITLKKTHAGLYYPVSALQSNN